MQPLHAVSCPGLWLYQLYGLLMMLLLTAAVQASETPDEGWLEDDSEWRALEVNEGELNFISPPEDARVLHASSHLYLYPESLQTGWAQLHQCYFHLDSVGRTEVVYGYREMKNLRIELSHRIGSAQVAGQTVQLEDVSANASLCVRAEVRVLNRRGDEYEIINGPYHRRFLDGYYPYHVSLTIYYPSVSLSFVSVWPEAQDSFVVKQGDGRVEIDSWFEGILRIRLLFRGQE